MREHELDPDRSRVRTPLVAATALVLVVVAVASATPAGATVLAATTESVKASLTWWRAVTLGVVEGVTEFLPISSTGHLLIASRLLGLPDQKGSAGLDAVNTYAIAIQFGAILAVAGLFWRRLREMVLGLFGRSESGRHLLITLVIAFIPAAVLGAAFDKRIEALLFGPWPIIAAWVAGGLLILGLQQGGLIRTGGHQPLADATATSSTTGTAKRTEISSKRTDTSSNSTTTSTVAGSLMEITYRRAAIIGLAQCFALWPGTSRSLATILAALLLGVSMSAAVEFSFLLGFLTLSAATAFKLLKDGGTLVQQFGVINPLIGAVFAFISAVVAIRWMIQYLKHHDLSIFAWYRFAAAVVAIGLIAANQI